MKISALLPTAVLLTLAAFSPVHAEPNAQLVRSVQNQLNQYGFSHIDASTLTSQQIGALHLKMSNSVSPFGYNAIRRKQEIKVILGWDE